MKSKVMNLKKAISQYVNDGDMIALGGFATNRRPYALVREIIRQKKKELYVESGAAGGDVDLLIGANLVKVINISYIANSGYTMVSRRFRDAVENEKIYFEDYSLDVQTIAYHGAALGLKYVAVKNMLGSDLVNKWGISIEDRKKLPKLPKYKFIIENNPFRKDEKLCLIPTPEIDVALVHVQKASPSGICIIEGPEFQDIDISVAAKKTIITCEELISDEEIRKNPNINSLPSLCVDAVVECSYGAHPSQCFGYYDYDPKAMIDYDKASRTENDFMKFLDEYIYVKHDEYLKKIGYEQLNIIKTDDIGYKKGLKRK